METTMDNGNRNDVKLFMMKNGVLKEIDTNRLSKSVFAALESAYDTARVVGISREVYMSLSHLTADHLADFTEAIQHEKQRGSFSDEFLHSKEFAQVFDLNHRDCPLMLDSIMWVNAMVNEDPSFTSRQVNARAILEALNYDGNGDNYKYRHLVREFKNWKKHSTVMVDTKVGFIKFVKFYYSVLSSNMADKAVELAVV